MFIKRSTSKHAVEKISSDEVFKKEEDTEEDEEESKKKLDGANETKDNDRS